MGKDSGIEYVDSAVNPMIGCDGCELYNPKWDEDDPRNTCYANDWVRRFAGKSKGYPASFSTPTLFTERIAEACRWRDLTGTARPHKPWLDGRPRVIFLDDLGDTFTESLPLDWLLPYVPAIEASPHVWLMFTKRPRRMRQFFERVGHVPRNVWPFTSVTGPTKMRRLDELREIDSPRLCVSFEPIFAALDIHRYLVGERRLAWVVAGFESGAKARAGHPEWARGLRDQCRAARVPFFFKQWGEYAPGYGRRYPPGMSRRLVHPDGVGSGGPDRLDEPRMFERFGGGAVMYRVGKDKSGRRLDGREWSEMPEAAR